MFEGPHRDAEFAERSAAVAEVDDLPAAVAAIAHGEAGAPKILVGALPRIPFRGDVAHEVDPPLERGRQHRRAKFARRLARTNYGGTRGRETPRRQLGRPRVLTPTQLREAKTMLRRGESPNRVARILRCGRFTLYRHLAIGEGQNAGGAPSIR